jgi:hypothetical protein
MDHMLEVTGGKRVVPVIVEKGQIQYGYAGGS